MKVSFRAVHRFFRFDRFTYIGTLRSKFRISIIIPFDEKKMVNNKFEGKVTGKVVEVCQEKGCWMKIEKPGGETLMVKFKDYGFFMPKDIVGKEVVLDGQAQVKETSVAQLQHYAKDAGKSKEEIEKIKKPKKEVQFVASGVLVL